MAPRFLNVIRAEKSNFGEGALVLDVEVELDDKSRETWPFHYVPGDKAPATIAVTQWLADHPDFPIAKARVLTAADFYLTRAEVRRAFVTMGLAADAVDVALKDSGYEMLRIDWMEAPSFPRDHPVIEATVHYYGLNAEALDSEWLTRANPPRDPAS